jgi:tripartite-type tricarboxylate transporter receptor subunit TctC
MNPGALDPAGRLTKMSYRRLCAIALLLIGFGSAVGAPKEEYPAHPVDIIVPVAPGAPTDLLARIVADRLSARWHQSVMVLNVTGGGQNIAAARVAHSPPDGYTLLVSPRPALTVNHLLYKELGYTPSQFSPITVLAQVPTVLVVRKDFPSSSLQDLIGYAKANPDKVTFGSQGLGSTPHLTASRLEALAGIKLVHVPYRGEVLVLNDIIAGHIDMFFSTLSSAVPLYRDGRLKILAIADSERSPAIPDVPTMTEAGLQNFQSTAWFAIVAPPNTDGSLVAKINRDVVAILKERDVSEKLGQFYLQPVKGSPSETASFIANETAIWSKVLIEANVPMQ